MGFLFAILMIMISLFLIICDGLYSREAYKGSWCNVCACLKSPENIARICFSIMFRILFFLLILVSLILSVVQIVNLVQDPRMASFPLECPSEESLIGNNGNNPIKHCLRITNTDLVNSASII